MCVRECVCACVCVSAGGGGCCGLQFTLYCTLYCTFWLFVITGQDNIVLFCTSRHLLMKCWIVLMLCKYPDFCERKSCTSNTPANWGHCADLRGEILCSRGQGLPWPEQWVSLPCLDLLFWYCTISFKQEKDAKTKYHPQPPPPLFRLERGGCFTLGDYSRSVSSLPEAPIQTRRLLQLPRGGQTDSLRLHSLWLHSAPESRWVPSVRDDT